MSLSLIGNSCAQRHMAARVVAGLAVLWCLLAPLAAVAQQQSTDPAPIVSLEPLKQRIQQLEEAVRDASTDEALAGLKVELEQPRTQLRGLVDEIGKQLADIDSRLKPLGTPPADGTTEDAAVTDERAQLTKLRDGIESALKQARLLALSADQLDDRISERRRELFASNLFRRSASILDPSLWKMAASAAVQQFQKMREVWDAGIEYARSHGGRQGAISAVLVLIALAVAGLLALRFLRRSIPASDEGVSQFKAAYAAMATLIRAAAVLPVGLFVIGQVLSSFDLLSDPIKAFWHSVIVGVAAATFGRGIALGLFAPDAAERRMVTLDDDRAARMALTLTWTSRVLGAMIFLDALHRTLGAPISLTVGTSALFGILISIIVIIFLVRRGIGPKAAVAIEERRWLAWLRVVLWLTVTVMIAALATGYVAFASFVGGRLLVAVGVFGALYLSFAFVDALFSEALAGDTPAGRRAGAILGLSPRGIGLLGTLASAVIRILLIVLALFMLLGPWGFFATDFFGDVKEGVYGFRVGDLTISLPAIVGAIAVLIIGILLVRTVQRWLDVRFLPRTGLEPSLQNSISTIFGYVTIIAVLAMALGMIGIDLQKFALIAGALSVGIGFGLQSIVSNFVSGLILLTERPIRVGDWVVVGSEEGHVRRIAVRATEIETFDRASVLIPNQQFITEVVKNWTHANTVGRVIIKVGVSYSSDAEMVRDVLIKVAEDHPLVLESPPPRALFLNFGDSSLDFELRAYIGNVDNSFMIKSDLNFAVLRSFRKAGIEIPFPQRDLHIRSGLQPRQAGVETAVDGAHTDTP